MLTENDQIGYDKSSQRFTTTDKGFQLMKRHEDQKIVQYRQNSGKEAREEGRRYVESLGTCCRFDCFIPSDICKGVIVLSIRIISKIIGCQQKIF
jgi:hypothetical protein